MSRVSASAPPFVPIQQPRPWRPCRAGACSFLTARNRFGSGGVRPSGTGLLRSKEVKNGKAYDRGRVRRVVPPKQGVREASVPRQEAEGEAHPKGVAHRREGGHFCPKKRMSAPKGTPKQNAPGSIHRRPWKCQLGFSSRRSLCASSRSA